MGKGNRTNSTMLELLRLLADGGLTAKELAEGSGYQTTTVLRYLKAMNRGERRIVWNDWDRDPRDAPVKIWFLGRQPNVPKPKPRQCKEYGKKYRERFKQLQVTHGLSRIPSSFADFERAKAGLPSLIHLRKSEKRRQKRSQSNGGSGNVGQET